MNAYRTLVVLWVAQSFGQTAAPIMVLVSGIVGARLAPSLQWSTLPLAMMVVGTAVSTTPASLLMSRIGRRAGFMIATGYAMVAGLVAAWAISIEHFYLFCFSAFLVGSYAAFLQQFRFAVAESVPAGEVARSVSLLMLAGIVAALLGPEVASRFSDLEGLPAFTGSFLGLSALMGCSFLVLALFYRNSVPAEVGAGGLERKLGEILRQPRLILAMTSAISGWSIMSLIMTATPVSMHQIDHYSLADTKWVIQSHILAMFIPSLFSGILISRFGVVRIIGCGLVIMMACLLVGYDKPMLMHYWGAMVLLGIGWNFMFVGGTTLLTECYRPAERFKVQALNDFLVFGLQAMGSLGAGLLLAWAGWNGVILFSLPWLLLPLPCLWLLRKETRQVANAS